MNCTSCNNHISSTDNFVKFKCPSCNEQLIVRCGTCRNNTIKYTCKKCGFVGP